MCDCPAAACLCLGAGVAEHERSRQQHGHSSGSGKTGYGNDYQSTGTTGNTGEHCFSALLAWDANRMASLSTAATVAGPVFQSLQRQSQAQKQSQQAQHVCSQCGLISCSRICMSIVQNGNAQSSYTLHQLLAPPFHCLSFAAWMLNAKC